MNLVSIIIPYYRNKAYIEQSVKSALNQTYSNIEIIIIYDDEDRSDLSLIEDIQKSDPRIKVIVNDTNLGAGFSRNKGIQFARGKFVAFLDSDDVWNFDKLDQQINFMEKNNFYISHCSYKILDEKSTKNKIRLAKNLNYSKLLKSCNIGLSTVVINKDILDNNSRFPKIKTKEDYVLWLILSKQGYTFYAVENVLVSWRVRKNSLSSSLSRKLIDGYTVYYKYMNFSAIKSLVFLFRLSLFYIWKNLNF